MAGDGTEAGRAPDVFEDEAEESGAEGGGEAEDGEAEGEDDGRDLEGFVVDDEGQAGAAAADGDSSSSSDEEDLENEELGEDDLAVLAEAGVDVSQVKRKRDDAEPASEEPASQRPRVEGGSGGGLLAAVRAAVDAGEEDFGAFSDDSVDDFIVDDPAAPRRGGESAGALGITEEQKQEIIDIFGDTSVLRPIDEVAELQEHADEDEPMEDAGVLVPASAPEAAPSPPAVRGLPSPWTRAYMGDPSLLGPDGTRVFSREEEQAEAQWIFHEAFSSRNREDTIEAIGDALRMLHRDCLEPVVVASQFECFLGRVLYKEDIWKVCDLDRHHFQRVWSTYRKLKAWESKLARVPQHIKDRLALSVFDRPKAELTLKDVQEWFLAEKPKDFGGEGHEPPRVSLARRCKFDAKLGAVEESTERMTLSIFSMRPADFGHNIERGERIHKPPFADIEEEKVKEEFLDREINEYFASREAVEEGIIETLAYLISKDPRVRNYVRQEFVQLCTVSTFVTEAGKPIAEEASRNFRKQYRAFHLVHRPLSEFKKDDDLFLEVLDLQRKGYVTVEYALITWPQGEKNYKYVVTGHDETDLTRDRLCLSEHMSNADPVTKFVPKPEGKAEQKKWEWSNKIRYRLEAAARSFEIANRTKSAKTELDKAETPFLCAAMNISHDAMNQIMAADPILLHLMQFYCKVEKRSETEFYVPDYSFNTVRKNVLKAVVSKLYLQFWAEVQADLTRRAEEYVCSECGKQLCSLVDRQPWRPTAKKEMDESQHVDDKRVFQFDDDDEEMRDPDSKSEKAARFRGYCSAIVIVPEVRDNFSVVAYINQFGDPVDMRKFFSNFYSVSENPLRDPKSHQELQRQKRLEHRNQFKKMLRTFEPAMILIPVTSEGSLKVKKGITALVEATNTEKRFRNKPTVVMCDPTVPRLVALHAESMQQGAYRDCISPLQRVALSMARFVQDPLAETAQLWGATAESNDLVKLRLHRLQDVVARSRLSLALENAMLDCVAKAGVHVNRLRASTHLMAVAKFLPGFGVDRMDIFRKCVSNCIKNRTELVQRIMHAFSSIPNATQQDCTAVVANCVPFMRICPDHRETWSARTTPAFDRTRVPDAFRPWMESLCKAALEDEERPLADDGEATDWVARAMGVYQSDRSGALKEKLNKLIWGDWDWQAAAGLTFPKCGQPEKLLDMLTEEVLDPGADRREPYAELTSSSLFSLAAHEPIDNFGAGALVHCIVVTDREIPDPDFPDRETKSIVRVKLQPSGIGGQFSKQYGAGTGKGYIEGCERHFQPEEIVLSRITRVIASEDRDISVQLTMDQDHKALYESLPVSGYDLSYFVPLASENWLQAKVGLVGSKDTNELAELKVWISRPRNIRHPNWVNGGHEQAMKEIARAPLGNVIFRPSKRHDVILAMLKVQPTDYGSGLQVVEPERCYRTFDVLEVDNKTITKGFELAHKLQVDGETYKDFDEIIARHVDPIMDNLRVMMEHHRFGLQDGQVTDKVLVTQMLYRSSCDDKNNLIYSLLQHDRKVGHGMLIWTLKAKQPREEFIEVHHKGFSLWGKSFSTLSDMIKWFKTVGYKISSQCRKEFKASWEQRRQEVRERRGQNAYADRPAKAAGWASTVTTLGSGLQTPSGGGMSTPKGGWNYTPEAAAPTPGGTKTPTGTATPAQNFAPATPFGAGSIGGGGASASGARPGWSKGSAAGTPGGWQTPARAPVTPAGMGSGSLQPQHVPATPLGVLKAAPTPAQASRTPAFAPQTPLGMVSAVSGWPPQQQVPPTPLAAPLGAMPVSGTPYRMPGAAAMTPAANFVPNSPGNTMGMPVTPGSFPSFQPASPAGPAAQTPLGARAPLAAAGTPGGDAAKR